MPEIRFTVADVPEQCLSCPAFDQKVKLGMVALHGSRSEEEATSDVVEEMQVCQTGPVEAYTYKEVTTIRDRGVGEFIEGVGPNFSLLHGNKIQERRYERTRTTKKQCGITVNPVHAVVEGDPFPADEAKALRKQLFKQEKAVRELMREREIARKPSDYLDPNDGVLNALARITAEREGPVLTEMRRAKQLGYVNRLRTKRGMKPVNFPITQE